MRENVAICTYLVPVFFLTVKGIIDATRPDGVAKKYVEACRKQSDKLARYAEAGIIFGIIGTGLFWPVLLIPKSVRMRAIQWIVSKVQK